MWIPFYKFHGTGNDFIIINKIDHPNIELNESTIKQLCDRRFGVGADGLMFMLSSDKYDFEMQYYNSDGKEGSMCGNGGRCIVNFAKMQNIIGEDTTFLAYDGIHAAKIDKDIVKLKMIDIKGLKKYNDGYFIDTGSPHFVCLYNNLKDIDIEKSGEKLRYDNRFEPKGTNVNFVEEKPQEIEFATYERGVERETLSCGTGAVATAIALKYAASVGKYSTNLKTKGGKLKVHFVKSENNTYTDIWLEGEAKFVFDGKFEI